MQFVTHSNKLLNLSLTFEELRAEYRIVTAGRTREEKRRSLVVHHIVLVYTLKKSQSIRHKETYLRLKRRA